MGDRSEWYFHPIFEPYWRNYAELRTWMLQREECERRERAMVDDRILNEWHESICPSRRSKHSRKSCSISSRPRHSRRGRPSRRRLQVPRQMKKKAKISEECNSDKSDYADEDSSGTEYEFQLTDDFVDFLKTSEAFRQQRDNEKNDKGEHDVEFIDLASVTIDGIPQSGLPNRKAAMEKELALMKEMYGEDAPTIIGLETAMRCSLKWLQVHKQPLMWPNIPLRIKFD